MYLFIFTQQISVYLKRKAACMFAHTVMINVQKTLFLMWPLPKSSHLRTQIECGRFNDCVWELGPAGCAQYWVTEDME